MSLLFHQTQLISKMAQRLADLEATVAAIDRSQAMIEFQLDGTIITANKNFLATRWAIRWTRSSAVTTRYSSTSAYGRQRRIQGLLGQPGSR
jgi:hypothetical protein